MNCQLNIVLIEQYKLNFNSCKYFCLLIFTCFIVLVVENANVYREHLLKKN